jgi:hypothetical protein
MTDIVTERSGSILRVQFRQPVRAQPEQAAKLDNEEYSARLRSADTKEANTALFEKRQPDLTRKREPVTVT